MEKTRYWMEQMEQLEFTFLNSTENQDRMEI
uniref:Uncharacterized protein n=1 Tax=Podoviridae sp. ct8Lf7 TaxID=2827723 RepID=A0A8S5S015_9CAUD|nr:MAG TPA: hypothetical protein [Podoviridae sp. ct8Lf7]